MKKESDWTFLSVLLIVVFAVFLTAKVTSWRTQAIVIDLNPPDIAIQITGAVKKPGSYTVSPGTPLSVVLKKAKPLKTADLEGVKLNQLLDESTAIVIPVRGKK